MIKKADLRARAQRFLLGEFCVEDISTLLLFVRANSFGKSTIHDLGHMVGHADLRDKGLSVDRIKALFTIARFKIGNEHAGSWQPDDAPAEILDVMKATLSLLSDDALKKDIGFGKVQVATALHKISKRFERKSNGNLEWIGYKPSEKEWRVMKCLTSYIISRPLYTPNELLSDFGHVLMKNGFIDADQLSLLAPRIGLLSAYALAAMHHVTFLMPDECTVESHSGYWTDKDSPAELITFVTFNILRGQHRLPWIFPLFCSGLHPKDWWEHYNSEIPQCSWAGPVELTNQSKLRYI